jgi:hypothetical protein
MLIFKALSSGCMTEIKLISKLFGYVRTCLDIEQYTIQRYAETLGLKSRENKGRDDNDLINSFMLCLLLIILFILERNFL